MAYSPAGVRASPPAATEAPAGPKRRGGPGSSAGLLRRRRRWHRRTLVGGGGAALAAEGHRGEDQRGGADRVRVRGARQDTSAASVINRPRTGGAPSDSRCSAQADQMPVVRKGQTGQDGLSHDQEARRQTNVARALVMTTRRARDPHKRHSFRPAQQRGGRAAGSAPGIVTGTDETAALRRRLGRAASQAHWNSEYSYAAR